MQQDSDIYIYILHMYIWYKYYTFLIFINKAISKTSQTHANFVN